LKQPALSALSAPSRSKAAFRLRGCRVSAPLDQPWGGQCRIIEWIDKEGQIARCAVAADVTEADVIAAMREHVTGRKHVLVDDERMPRQTLPRR
jgi:hypothetical protein